MENIFYVFDKIASGVRMIHPYSRPMEKQHGSAAENARVPAWRAAAVRLSFAVAALASPSVSAGQAGNLRPGNGCDKLVGNNHATMTEISKDVLIKAAPAEPAKDVLIKAQAEPAKPAPAETKTPAIEAAKTGAGALRSDFETGRKDYFTAMYEGLRKDFSEAISHSLARQVENLKKDLRAVADAPKSSEVTAEDRAAAKSRLAEIEDRERRGFTWDAAGIFAAFVEGRTYGGAGISFAPEHVGEWADRHLRVGIGAGKDGSGNAVPGLSVSVVYGGSGERFGWSAGAGAVNGFSLAAGAEGRVYLNNGKVEAAAAEGNAKSRTFAGVAGGVSTTGGAFVGIEAGQAVKEGVDREKEEIRKGLAELLFSKKADGSPAVAKIADVDAADMDSVPSLKGKRDGEKLLAGLKEISKRVLAAYAFDALEAGPQACAKSSAVEEVSTGKYDAMMNQVLGWHFGRGFVGFGTTGLVAGVSALRDSGERSADLAKKHDLENALAGGYNAEPAAPAALAESHGVEVSEKAVGGKKVVELSTYGARDVRVDLPAGMERFVEVRSRIVEGQDGFAPETVIRLSADGVKAVLVGKILAGAGDLDQLVVRVNPEEAARVRVGAARAKKGSAVLRGKPAGKGDFKTADFGDGSFAGSADKGADSVKFLASTLTNSNQAEYREREVGLGVTTDFKGKEKSGNGSSTRPEDGDSGTGGTDPDQGPDNGF